MNKNEIISLPVFEEIKPHILSKKENANINTAWYENGVLVNVSPRDENVSLDEDRQVAYSARYIISDGKKYDLYNPFDIMSIEIPETTPKTDVNDEGGIGIGMQMPYVTRELSYHLQMRVKGTFSKELAIPLVFKTANLLMATTIGYGKATYERMVEQLYAVNAMEYADYLDKEFQDKLPFYNDPDYFHKLHFRNTLEKAKEMGYDCLEIPYSVCACGVCAKYMGRYYSISGTDKRFPMLPKEIIEKSQIHEGCSCTFYAFHYFDGSKMDKWVFDENGVATQEFVDIIESSNRPFVDDRSEGAIAHYNRCKEKREKDRIIAAKRKMSRNEWRDWGARNVEYEWLEENLPELCPKSLAGYSRMKKACSKKYLELKGAALSLGMVLNDNNI